MQEALLGDTQPGVVGHYRDEQVWIGGQLPQSATFVPPHHDRVDEAMDDLITFTPPGRHPRTRAGSDRPRAVRDHPSVP